MRQLVRLMTCTVLLLCWCCTAHSNELEHDITDKWSSEVVNGELVLTLPAKIHFEFDSDDINEDITANQIADFMKSFQEPIVLTIEGHTDEVGSDVHNGTLSLSRANMLKDNLLLNGVHPSSIQVVGASSKYPVEGTGVESHANRRLELSITYK
jgi:outer membrane protein OmpA-like peptidoglycan-associated protein